MSTLRALTHVPSESDVGSVTDRSRAFEDLSEYREDGSVLSRPAASFERMTSARLATST